MKYRSALLGTALAVSVALANAQEQKNLPTFEPFVAQILKAPMPLSKAVPTIKSTLGMAAFASKYNYTVDFVSQVLAKDPTAWVDIKGNLYFVEPSQYKFSESPTASPESVDVFSTTPSAQAFLLNSRPGASKVLYLDFDGETVSGTGWNQSFNVDPIRAEPFNIEGSPSTFSETERQRIIQVWKIVAEDYSAFPEINVTTQYPGEEVLSSANGLRVLVTKDWTGQGGSPCNCGGVAYLGSWGSSSTQTKPAWVFYNQLGGSAKNIAEAASHEAGHAASLSHDSTSKSAYWGGHGSGNLGYAAIMGVGYGKRISTWDKGTYPDAQNKEDDLARIASSLRISQGESTTPNIYTDKLETLTLPTSGGSGSHKDLIASELDSDVFQIPTGVGSLSVTVSPYTGAPNMKMFAQLSNAKGEVLKTASSSTDVVASLSYNNPANEVLFLTVRGDGHKTAGEAGGFSRYGSIGNYEVKFSGVGTDPNNVAQARYNQSQTSALPLQSISFDAQPSSSISGSIVSYAWDFGDGSTAEGAQTSKSFTVPGTYNVKLRVMDERGFSSEVSKPVSIGLNVNNVLRLIPLGAGPQ